MTNTAGGVFTLPPQDMPYFARAIEFAVVFPGRVDLDAQGGVGLRPARCPVRITRDGLPVIVSGRAELRSRVLSDRWRSPAHPADRLDPE